MSTQRAAFCFLCPADADCVALLCAMGALQQKPRAQHLGPFLQQCMQQVDHFSWQQLVEMLQAMAQLQLTPTETQVQNDAAHPSMVVLCTPVRLLC